MSAFARARAMFAAIAAAMAIGNLGERQARLDKIGPYRSRGKGRGTPSRRFGNPSGRSYPHHSDRECARRRKQDFAEHPRAVKLAHKRRSA